MKFYRVEVKCRSREKIENMICYSEYRGNEWIVVPMGCDAHTVCDDCYHCRVDAGRSIMESVKASERTEERVEDKELLYR